MSDELMQRKRYGTLTAHCKQLCSIGSVDETSFKRVLDAVKRVVGDFLVPLSSDVAVNRSSSGCPPPLLIAASAANPEVLALDPAKKKRSGRPSEKKAAAAEKKQKRIKSGVELTSTSGKKFKLGKGVVAAVSK
jgi:hypothetical protein